MHVVCTVKNRYLPFCISVRNCLSDPCQNAGTCQEVEGGYECTCHVDYIGKHCEHGKTAPYWYDLSSPDYLLDKVYFAHQQHSYKTTSSVSENLYIPHGHSNSLFTESATMWNTLPPNMRNNSNIVTFKKQLIRYILKEHSKF